MSEFAFEPTPRRGFLARMAAGAVALAASGLATSRAEAESVEMPAPSDWDNAWLTKIKGKYRQVFDAMEVHSGFPLRLRWKQSLIRSVMRSMRPSRARYCG